MRILYVLFVIGGILMAFFADTFVAPYNHDLGFSMFMVGMGFIIVFILLLLISPSDDTVVSKFDSNEEDNRSARKRIATQSYLRQKELTDANRMKVEKMLVGSRNNPIPLPPSKPSPCGKVPCGETSKRIEETEDDKRRLSVFEKALVFIFRDRDKEE